MIKPITPLFGLFLAACNADAPSQRSLCDLPHSFAGWSGNEVRWQGLIVDSSRHGKSFLSEDCRRRGANIKAFAPVAEDQYTRFLSHHENTFWAHVDMTAKISSDQKLIVLNFHSLDAIGDDVARKRAQSLGF